MEKQKVEKINIHVKFLKFEMLLLKKYPKSGWINWIKYA